METDDMVEKAVEAISKAKAGAETGIVADGAKKILMVVAQKDFKDAEYFTPKDRFEKAGFAVVTVAKCAGVATSVDGVQVHASEVANEDVADYEAVILVGGPGITAYYADSGFQGIAKKANSAGKLVGAICLAPNILANAGLLEGKKATVYGSESQLVSRGADYTGEEVTVDGNVVTAIGPGAANGFADAILRELSK